MIDILKEVNRVSRLLTDMCISNASHEELEKVINYSIDVIDTLRCEVRCEARCKQRAIDNDIAMFEEKYGFKGE